MGRRTRSGFDFAAQRKTIRDLRVVQHAEAAVDYLWELARGKSRAKFMSALIFWFDKIAEEYEGEIASLKTALNTQKTIIRQQARRISDEREE